MKHTLHIGSLIRLTRYKDDIRDQIAVVTCIRAAEEHEHELCGHVREDDSDRVVMLHRCTDPNHTYSRNEWCVGTPRT